MTYKPVGVDEASDFPPRVETRLSAKTQALIDVAVNALVSGAPAALDTLNELAAQLANDESAVAALTAAVAAKASQADLDAVTTALGTKVNSSTYTAGLAAKQDTATMDAAVADKVTNGTATKTALDTAYARRAPAWVTGRDYIVDELVLSGGTLYRVTTAHTSSGSIDLSKFTAVSAAGGGGGTSSEDVLDIVGIALVGSGGIAVNYDDPSNTITIDGSGVTGSGGSTDPEVVRDTIAAALVAGAGVTITPNDATDTITIAATGGGGGGTSGAVILDHSTPTVSPGIVNTTTETTLFSLNIPAAQVAAGDLLTLTFAADCLNNTGAGTTATYKVKIGATTIFNIAHSPGTSVNRTRIAADLRFALASLTDLRCSGTLAASAAVGSGNMQGAAQPGVGSAQITSENLATDKTLTVTCTLSTANTLFDVRPMSAYLKRERP